MNFLRFLEGIRTPLVTAFMSLITYCGSEIFFIAVAVTVFWCVSKRDGYYIMIVGFLGSTINQFLKLWFRIPRPWILDPDFTVVESARPAATGYSFPSGHTQNIVGTTACVLLMTWPGFSRRISSSAMDDNRNLGRNFSSAANGRQNPGQISLSAADGKWNPGQPSFPGSAASHSLGVLCVRIAAVALMILVPFSRMYLGCHTPLDVSVSFVIALFLAVTIRPLVLKNEKNPRFLWIVVAISMAIALLYWAFVTFYPFPADVDLANLSSGVKNSYKLIGCIAGLAAAKVLDDRYIHFEVEAPWQAQILKTGLGLLFVLAIMIGLKAPLQAVFPVYMATTIRYSLVVFFAGAVWPLTFSWFAGLNWGRNN